VLFAVCAPGIEPVLLSEVQALGAAGRAVAGGVLVEDDAQMMRLNLMLRTASRVLLRLGEVKATAFDELVRKASALPWEKFVGRGARAAFHVTCRKSRLYHSSAVKERLHAALEKRAGFAVPTDESGQLFVARFDRDVCTVSADTSGALLHQRGYRLAQGQAPLRETLAAALLFAAGFHGEESFCDPLCGSGTIAIEAALIAARRAPGIGREFAFEKWPAFEPKLLQQLRDEARSQERRISVSIEASDAEAGAVAAARENAARAGVFVQVQQRTLTELPPLDGTGLIACNPPYGVRLGGDLRRTYRELGDALRRRPQWRLAAILADEKLARAAALPWRKLLHTQNGGLRVEMLLSACAP